MPNKKRIVTVAKKDVSKMSYRELWEEFKWLRPCGQLMHNAHGELNRLVKKFCWGDGRKRRDDYLETRLVRMEISDPFNPFDIMSAANKIGRTPMATFDIFIGYVWSQAKEGKKDALKKTVRFAIKHGFAVYVK